MTIQAALLCLPQSEQIPTNINTELLWGDVVHDPYGCFDPNYPGRLTVPVGFQYARVNLSIVWPLCTVGERQIVTRKNAGANFYKGGIVDNTKAIDHTTTDHGKSSAWVPVVAGDFFSVYAWQTSGGDLWLPVSTGTWFELEFK